MFQCVHHAQASFDVLDIGVCGDWVPIECSITETNLIIYNYLRTTYNTTTWVLPS